MENDWRFDSFVDEDSLKLLERQHITGYQQFLETFSKQLLDMESVVTAAEHENCFQNANPIGLLCDPPERVSLATLVNSKNANVNKVVLVISSLCQEIGLLVKEGREKFLSRLLMYGEGQRRRSETDSQLEGQVQMSRLVGTIQQLFCFINRSYEVLRNIMQQLCILTNLDRSRSVGFDCSDSTFVVCFELIGDLLVVLVTMDSVIAEHKHLKSDWSIYKRCITAVHNNPSKFAIDIDSLRPFEKLLWQWEGQVLDGVVFHNCVEQNWDTVDSENFRVQVSKAGPLAEVFGSAIRTICSQLESTLDTENEMRSDTAFGGVLTLFLLHTHLWRNYDKKLFKSVWDLTKKSPQIVLYCNVSLNTVEFLAGKLSTYSKLVTAKLKNSAAADREAYTKRKVQMLLKDVFALKIQVEDWAIHLEQLQCLSSSPKDLIASFSKASSVLLQGVFKAQWLNNQLRRTLCIHLSDGIALSKSVLVCVFFAAEALKLVESAYDKNSLTIADLAGHLCQHNSLIALNILQSLKKRFHAEKRHERRPEVLNLLSLAENCLSGPPTQQRLCVGRVALTLAGKQKTFREPELDDLALLFEQIDILSRLPQFVKSATDCSFLYFLKSLVPLFFEHVRENADHAYIVPPVVAALADVEPLMHKAVHLESPQQLIRSYKEFIMLTIHEKIVDPLSTEIENNLRIQIHSHLLSGDRNPFTSKQSPISLFFQLPPFRIFDEFFHIKLAVESFLDAHFYDHTTVALHDWRSYDQMKHLAMQIYGLDFMEPHLPAQTLEQGLDVLEIMRQIKEFVRHYMYNLNNQVFVERSSNNKHLNTISIRHVANSIRTHGTGIMNTAVNYTYQFLIKKFATFSQFLFDEQIKGKLIKEWKYFRENHMHKDQKFPFERAEAFNKWIRGLPRSMGSAKDGFSYIDLFRQLITEIGNSMAYVRMIRSGGLHCVSNAIRFVPELEDVQSFEELVTDAKLSERSLRTSRNLDIVVLNLIKSFTEGTEYFKLLVDIFAPHFRSDKNKHLQNFFLILPALTLNYVENMISCKEKLTRKNKTGAAFTDDGFAIGVAYILKLLDQNQRFDSLHWFQSVREYYRRMKKLTEAQKQNATSKNDDKLLQTITLSLRRLDVYTLEFEVLNYSLSSARIFFREKSTGKAAENESGEKQLESSTESSTAAAAATAASTSGVPPPPPPPPPAPVL